MYQGSLSAPQRVPVAEPDKGDKEFHTEVNAFVDIVLENLPATAGKLKEIESLQDEDPVCQQIKVFCEKGWPKSKSYRSHKAVFTL